MMGRDFDYAVLGLGGIGSAAAYWFSLRPGMRVLGLEQFELGHVRGESQDHSRIIRLSYHAPEYVRLARRSYASWAKVESDAGEQLILKTGGLDLGPDDGAIPLQTYADAMSACDVPFETLDASEIMHRWPPFRVDANVRGLYQPESGIAMAARANAAHQRLAREHGATLRDRAPVTAIRDDSGEFDIEAGGERYRCAKLAIAAGPWSNGALAHFGLRLPLEVTKEQVTYFAPPDATPFEPGRFPVWIWMDDPCFYGFPVFGEAGPKVAQDAGGAPVDPDRRDFAPDPDNEKRVRDFVGRVLPAALGPAILTKTCLYTLTPDRDFVVDFVPGSRNAAIAVGAGHAFKFASVLGRILTELVIDGRTESDIGLFSIDRDILKEAAPPKTYMK